MLPIIFLQLSHEGICIIFTKPALDAIISLAYERRENTTSE